jgi:sulfoxide reductase catalytic subunit YedY
MLLKKQPEIRYSEITPKHLYSNRRKFIAEAALVAGAALTGIPLAAEGEQKIPNIIKGPFGTDEKWTPLKDITNYNNFYEFSSDKYEPAGLAKNLHTRPWKVKVDGEVEQSKTYDVDEIIGMARPEERVYRLRCVEGWSMVIPWVGFPLNELIKRAKPTSKAKYVKFTTLYDPSQMPGQRTNVLAWPYTEGLRMDEAMHPLAILCFGLYGETLPNVDGAPLRVVVPWKYGFKSAKSLVKISFVKNQPNTAWNEDAPNEYGFYSNVNPNVDHPRWSQARERRIGEFFKRPTLMFNGYGDQVASLYQGMDLKKYF